jgi:hypothetical protein
MLAACVEANKVQIYENNESSAPATGLIMDIYAMGKVNYWIFTKQQTTKKYEKSPLECARHVY